MFMPHVSLLYGYLTDDEKKTTQDQSIGSLSFYISRLVLESRDVAYFLS